jgi:hypothetical protein
MERALEIFAVIHFSIVGVSHIVNASAWTSFFLLLRERGHAGVLVHGFLSLGFGSMIVAFHRVWSGIPAVLTILGCIYLLKAVLCFVFPTTQMRSLGLVSHDRLWGLRVAGVVFVGVAGLLSYSLWLA